MKIAIIGAGFAGLGCAKFLTDSGASVTIFDEKGVGGGASSVCSGLLHPYPGFGCRRSFKAREALSCAKELIRLAEANTPKQVSSQNGIFRKALTVEQKERLLSHVVEYGDVEQTGDNLFLIHSGITVHSKNYLEGLFRYLQNKGVELRIQKINTLDELKFFDHIVIAAGYGVREFVECGDLKIKFLKGQILHLKGKPPYERSFISKGYVAHLGSSTEFELGSTYEREFVDDLPDLARAKELFYSNNSKNWELGERVLENARSPSYLVANPQGEILCCKAAVRVCNRSHYLPIIQQVTKRAHVFTALGSRGLLYHGLFGRQLAHSILSAP